MHHRLVLGMVLRLVLGFAQTHKHTQPHIHLHIHIHIPNGDADEGCGMSEAINNRKQDTKATRGILESK